MTKILSISDELYARLLPMTNKEGGRSVKKIGFGAVIEQALNDQDRLKRRKVGYVVGDITKRLG